MGRTGGITRTTFLQRSKKVHGDAYDYGEVEINPTLMLGEHSAVKIRCKRHNYIFYEHPSKHYEYKKYSHRANIRRLPVCCHRGNDIIFLTGGYLKFLDKVEELGQTMTRTKIAAKLGYHDGSFCKDVKKCERRTGRKIKIKKHGSTLASRYEGKSGLIETNAGLSLFENGIEIKRQCTSCGKMKDKEEDFYSKSSKEPHHKRRKCKECWISQHGGSGGFSTTEAYDEWRKTYKQKDGYRERQNEYHRKRRKDPTLKLIGNLRCRVGDAFRAAKKLGFAAVKKTKTLDLLGAESWYQVKEHLESKFLPGMSWENHGKWHIDHNKPVDYFIKNKDFTDEKVQKECFHYLNLQPLWASDNLRKRNKMPFEIKSIFEKDTY